MIVLLLLVAAIVGGLVLSKNDSEPWCCIGIVLMALGSVGLFMAFLLVCCKATQDEEIVGDHGALTAYLVMVDDTDNQQLSAQSRTLLAKRIEKVNDRIEFAKGWNGLWAFDFWISDALVELDPVQ